MKSRVMNCAIYGCGEVGMTLCDTLLKNNFTVSAFLDKGKTGYYRGIPIFFPDATLAIGKETVIIIGLSDGTQHRQVAEELFGLGYKKIVFLPICYTMNFHKKIILTNLYNAVLEGQYVLEQVKNYDEICQNASECTGVITKNDNYVLCWIGHEILFSENIDTWKGDKNKIRCVNHGIDVNLNQYYWYHDLYDYLEGKREDCNSYLSIFNYIPGSDEAKRKLVNREKLYCDFMNNLQQGMDFFKLAAPYASWNEYGYFNIIGGNHRTIFLQHQGFHYYPIKILHEDYFKWMNQEKLDEVISYMKEKGVQNTYVPVPHPYFYDYPSIRETCRDTLLSAILNYMGPVRLTGKKVVDVSQYEGYFARIASRMRAEKIDLYTQDNGFIKLLMELLHIDRINYLASEDEAKEAYKDADYVFAMGNALNIVIAGDLKNFRGELFVEAEKIDEQLIKSVFSHTCLRNYKKLFNGVSGGKGYEVAVFNM